MAASPNTCLVCLRASSACAQCGHAKTCSECAERYPQQVRAHQAICFSITAPVNAVERTITALVGELGAVHQYVSALAWALAERTGRVTSDARDCLAGVIANDFPIRDEYDTDREYVAKMLTAIEPRHAPYITDRRFLLQPTDEARWAAAAVYKGVPKLAMALLGVRPTAMDFADEMLAVRTSASRVNYHVMRSTPVETDAEVVDHAVATSKRWYRVAVLRRRVFLIGRIWHMVEDSFSPAHTDRDTERRMDTPYGRIRRIYCFEEQTDESHSTAESISAVLKPGSVGARRVEVAIIALSDILLRYERDIAAMPTPDEAYAQRAADEFGEFMRRQVLALA